MSPDPPPAELTRWHPATLSERPAGDLRFVIAEDPARDHALVERWPVVGADGRLERQTDDPVARVPLAADDPATRYEVDLLRGGSAFGAYWPDQADGDVAVPSVARPKTGLGGPLTFRPEQLEAAFGATYRPYAWRLWSTWHGDIDLIFQIARVTAQALEGFGPVSLSIRVFVRQDEEGPFTSPEQLRTDLTDDAKRRLHGVSIEGRGRRISARTTLTRRRDEERTWIKDIVLLEVTSEEAEDALHVAAIRDRLADAVARGESRLLGSSGSGEGFRAEAPDGEPITYGPETLIDEVRFAGGMFFVLMGMFAMVAVVPVVAAVGGAAVLVTAGAGALLGLLAAATFFYSGVALSSSNRRRRVRTAVGSLAGGAVGAAISFGVGEGLKQIG